MVDEPSCIPHHRRIYDVIAVLSKHVAAHRLAFVVLLSLIGENRSNDFSRILDDHLTGVNVSSAEETATVNVRPIDSNSFLRKNTQMTEPHGHRQIKAGAASTERDEEHHLPDTQMATIGLCSQII